MFSFLFVLEIGLFLSFFVSPLGGGETAKAGPAFVEFSGGIRALSLLFVPLARTHAAHVRPPGFLYKDLEGV